jgi:hypothetical protein
MRSDHDTDEFVSSGASILDRSEAVGSGLKESWRDEPNAIYDRSASSSSFEEPRTAMDAFRQGGLLASLEFLTRPRIQEIGTQPQTSPAQEAPGGSEVASDSNWVAGATRGGQVQPALAMSSLGTGASPLEATSSVGGGLQQVSAQSSAPGPSPVSQAVHSFNVVPMERLSQIEAEVRQADLDRLNLILSRLMAAQASAMETEVVERAANVLAASATDSVTAGRARMLAETAERYRRIATRRDGQNVLQTHATLPAVTGGGDWTAAAGGNLSAVVPAASPSRVQASPAANRSPLPGIPPQNPGHLGVGSGGVASAGTDVMKQTGYLVQVYSARSNSPPFALTDNAGRTVAYVTPVPGVNLRTHLNSHINVVGTRGYLTGLNTPHIMVTQAVRTPEP